MFRATSLFFCCLSVVATLVVLSGCGIKPSRVLMPEDGQEVTYPRTYPDATKNLP